MGRKLAMAYPAPTPSGPSNGSTVGARAMRPSAPACAATSFRSAASPRCQTGTRTPAEGEHQREKLQFALAVALTRGDLARSQQLRDQIAALGEELEEPGT